MKKNKQNTLNLASVFGILLFININSLNAQVGIGNSSPASTLDISAINGTGTTTNVDGILIPRVDRQRALSMTAIPASTLIYVNSILTGTATGQAININSTGFYYFDSSTSIWTKLDPTGNDWSITGNTGTLASTNFIGTTDAIDFISKTNNTERTRITSAGNFGVGTSSPASGLSIATNESIGATYASTNAAPTNGLRVQGKTVIGKASGEDSRDIFSSHTSATSYNNITGYANSTANRAIAGYADTNGVGVFGYSNRTGYGLIGLTQSALSSYIQGGEGVLGQADGATGVTVIPIGVHGIIDETVAGLATASPILGENNTITRGTGFGGGAYNTGGTSAVAGVYGNIGSRQTSSSTNSYMFGIVGDVLSVGSGVIADGSGGVLGANGSGDFGMLGYRSLNGSFYSVYGGNSNGSISSGNSGRSTITTLNEPNNTIGLGINGGFMGGYIKGNQYGMLTQGKEFGMYVQGKTIVNEPIVQLIDTEQSKRTVTYTPTSTEVDVTTRGIGKLTNGEAFVPFKESFKNLVSENTINITITPTGETNGVYINSVHEEGFYVKENQGGTSTASFNWIAIGTRKGFENGIEISNTILANEFDNNINGVMSNDGTLQDGTPIHYNGVEVVFERMPENLIKYNTKKESNKKN
jgi:hypothetical protein